MISAMAPSTPRDLAVQADNVDTSTAEGGSLSERSRGRNSPLAELENALQFLSLRDAMLAERPVDVHVYRAQAFTGDGCRSKRVRDWTSEDALCWLMMRNSEARTQLEQILWEAKVAARARFIGNGIELLSVTADRLAYYLGIPMAEANDIVDALIAADAFGFDSGAALGDFSFDGLPPNPVTIPNWRTSPWTSWETSHFESWARDVGAELGLMPTGQLLRDLRNPSVIAALKANPSAMRYIWDLDPQLEARFNELIASSATRTGQQRTRSLMAGGGMVVENRSPCMTPAGAVASPQGPQLPAGAVSAARQRQLSAEYSSSTEDDNPNRRGRRGVRKTKKKVTDVSEEDIARLWEELKDIVPKDLGTVVIWEFFLYLLENPQTYFKYIRWEERDKGVFNVSETQKVAALWRFYRKKPEPGVRQKRISWANMSRAIRFHYKKYFGENEKGGKRKTYRFSDTVVQERLKPVCAGDEQCFRPNVV